MPNLHALVCPCGSLNFDHTLVMFPLYWVAKCHCCGRPILQAYMKPSAAKRTWIEGYFDENSRWIDGKFI